MFAQTAKPLRGRQAMEKKPRIYTINFARVYPEYVNKAERKGRTKEEVDELILWLTGYDQNGLEDQIAKGVDMETFCAEAPEMNPSRSLITGSICGYKVQEIEDPTTQDIRYLDKIIDELAKGKAMDKIKRTA
jgi:hypothetical protein